MKNKFLSVLMLVPFLVACPGQVNIETMPDDFVPDLPDFKDKNTGEIKQDTDNVYFDFYEISDFHGAVNYNPDNKELGLARLSTYYDTKRRENPGGTFLISGGDMWQGSADSNLTRGTMVTYAMDVMDFDAMTLGNHEFDWTTKWIKNNAERATFPLLAANLIDTATGETASFVHKSTVIQRGDYKVGIIGTIGDNIKNTIIASALEGYEFANEISTVKAEASRLRSEEHCDIVVWSAHQDAALLKSRVSGDDPGVDLVFGGHSHNTFDETLNEIAFLQSKAYSHSLPHAQLRLNKQTRNVSLVTHEVDDNPASGTYDEDPDIVGIKKQYDERFINPVKNQKVGKASGKFTTSETLANFAVYSMKEELKRSNEYKNYDILCSFHNINGGVRKDIEAGEILFGTVYESFPFDNEIVIVKVKGKTLWKNVIPTGNTAIWRAYKNEVEDIQDNEEYYFITTDFLLTNADYFADVDTLDVIYTNILVRDSVANQIKSMKTIAPENFKSTLQEFNRK